MNRVPTPSTCPTCGKRFGSLHALEQHHKAAHGRALPRTCPVCGKACKGRTGLRDHMRDAHGVLPESEPQAASRVRAPKGDRRHRGHSRDMHGDWSVCGSCGAYDLLVPEVGMCGPCTFGEAATAGGAW